MAQRFDRSSFERPVRTPAGYLRSEAYLTRAGIFTYRDSAGNTVRELRKPSEVFRGDSIATLSMAPVCDDHPSERVDASNAKKYAVGSVGDSLQKDGDFLRGMVMITDAAMIEKIEKEDKKELSCGYTCEVEPTPGVYNGEHYDAVQRNIVYNHLAVVAVGRAGPEVKLRLDSAVQVDEPKGQKMLKEDSKKPASQAESENNDSSETAGTKGGAGSSPIKTKMMKIGDKDFEIESKAADAMEEWMKDAGTMLGRALMEKDAKKAKSDALEEKVAALKKQAADPARFAEAVRSRISLEKNAARVLGEDTKLDSMTDDDIKKAIVLKISPEAKLDGVSDTYLQGRYDAAVENVETDSFGKFAKTVAGATKADAQEDKLDAAAAKERFLARSQNAWKTDAVNGTSKKQVTGAKA